jgi:hypothetical protein
MRLNITPAGSSSSGGSTLPEVYTDPVSPAAGDTWILATQVSYTGQPIGMLLGITYAADTYTYQLSYRTTEGTTIRTTLS